MKAVLPRTSAHARGRTHASPRAGRASPRARLSRSKTRTATIVCRLQLRVDHDEEFSPRWVAIHGRGGARCAVRRRGAIAARPLSPGRPPSRKVEHAHPAALPSCPALAPEWTIAGGGARLCGAQLLRPSGTHTPCPKPMLSARPSREMSSTLLSALSSRRTSWLLLSGGAAASPGRAWCVPSPGRQLLKQLSHSDPS